MNLGIYKSLINLSQYKLRLWGNIRTAVSDLRSGDSLPIEIHFSKNCINKSPHSSHNYKDDNVKSAIENLYLCALGSKGAGRSRSLLVCSDTGKYLFNCGDGLIRVCNEINSLHSNKIKLCGVFITSNQWKNVSGIYDLYLKINEGDSRSSVLHIFGARGLEGSLKPYFQHFLDKNCTSKFNVAKFHELTEQDNPLLVNSLQVTHVPLFSSSESRNSLKYYVIAFVCHAKENIRKLLSVEKLVRHNVPPGPLVSELVKGHSVTLPCGAVVHHTDVTNTLGDTGRNFIVLDIPSVDYLQSLISCSQFEPYMDDDCLQAIVHFSPDEVIRDPRYLTWMSRFRSSVSHLMVNDTCGGIDLYRSAILQKALNFIQPSVYPLNLILRDEAASLQESDDEPPGVKAESGLTLHLRPEISYDRKNCFAASINELLNQCYPRNVLEESKLKLDSVPGLTKALNDPHKQFPQIHFFGTGSSLSTSYRNESSILVYVDDCTNFLLDCGPGTVAQMYRHFGRHAFFEVLRKLKLIYISHHHKDHYLGLNSLLAERSHLLKEYGNIPKIYVMGMPRVLSFLKVLEQFEPVDDKVKIMNNRIFNFKNPSRSLEAEELCSYLKLKSLKTTLLPHCELSYGVAFTHRDGWKLVYSGDTLPSDNLVKIGRNCDILIHEATFQESMLKVAASKHHSTVSQAIHIGQKMEAKNVILTHFSQRYQKLPVIENDLPKNVCVAFDNMKVSSDDIPLVSKIYPVVKDLWFDEYEKRKFDSQMREERETSCEDLKRRRS